MRRKKRKKDWLFNSSSVKCAAYRPCGKEKEKEKRKKEEEKNGRRVQIAFSIFFSLSLAPKLLGRGHSTHMTKPERQGQKTWTLDPLACPDQKVLSSLKV
jgi:hypothetical protein